MKIEPLLTIATPTYNRAHTLPGCYQSLLNQDDRGFIWLIIDDGSTDETEKLVTEWIKEGKISIQYIKKANGGKASALNAGLEVLDTPYAVCLDSDDLFYPGTVGKALKALKGIDKNPYSCGCLALRTGTNGDVIGGKRIPEEYRTVSAEEVFLKFGLHTEVICFYKTEILQKYRFPEFPGEKFVSPAWMQYKITQNYYFLVLQDKMCCCEYLADGLTENKKKVIVNNPRGYSCVKRWSFNLAPTMKLRIKHGIMYDCGCILGHDRNWLLEVRHKITAILLMPAAAIVCRIRFKDVKKNDERRKS